MIRLRLTDAEVFTEVRDRGEVARLPVLEVLRTQPRNVLITTGLRFSQIALFVLLTTYSLTYLQDSSAGGQSGRPDGSLDRVGHRPGQYAGMGNAVGP